MAYKIQETSETQISLEEFIEYVQTKVDFRDEASILGASNHLYRLYKNRNFPTDKINNELKMDGFQKNNVYSGQSLILHSHPSFLVRAVTWLPESSNPIKAALERDISFYGVAHDHAFNLLTIGYQGSGYETEFYEYDKNRVLGYLGEKVEINYLEKTQLGFGEILFMRESKDIHIQYLRSFLSNGPARRLEYQRSEVFCLKRQDASATASFLPANTQNTFPILIPG